MFVPNADVFWPATGVFRPEPLVAIPTDATGPAEAEPAVGFSASGAWLEECSTAGEAGACAPPTGACAARPPPGDVMDGDATNPLPVGSASIGGSGEERLARFRAAATGDTCAKLNGITTAPRGDRPDTNFRGTEEAVEEEEIEAIVAFREKPTL